MAVAIPVASGTASAQVTSGPATVVGVSFRESAGTPAAASFVLRDGTTTGDPVRFVRKLVASGADYVRLPEVAYRRLSPPGEWLDRGCHLRSLIRLPALSVPRRLHVPGRVRTQGSDGLVGP
jgi:hypothetical protein